VIRLFLRTSFHSSLGDLASTTLVGFGDRLDDTNSNGLSHVTNGETTKRWVVSESLDTHGLGWNHLDDGSITRLDKFGGVLDGLSGSSIDLLEELGELASNVGCMAIEDWCVASTNLTGVVEDDDLSIEGLSGLWWIVLGVTSNVTTADFLDGDVLDVEANIVTWKTLDELFVVHLDRLDFGSDTSRGEGDNHTGLDYTSLNTTDRNRANTGDLVHVLKGQTKGLVGWARRWVDGIDGFEKGLAGGLAGLGLLLPTLVPWGIRGDVDHVVAVETRDGDEWHGLWVVADLLDKVGSFLDDFHETILGPLGGVHLVDGNDELLDTEGIGEKGVLTSLAILGDTSLELTSTGSNDENGAVGLGGTCDHVLDEITVTWGIDNSDHVLGCLELPQSDIDGDTTLTLGLEFVKNPRIFEGALAQLGSFLLKLLDGTLVDSTALIDQVTGGGGLARVDMADNNDIDVSLLFTHVDGFCGKVV